MQLFSSGDTATTVGEAIAVVIAGVVYIGFIVLIANLLLHALTGYLIF
jgi:hypothetical protein